MKKNGELKVSYDLTLRSEETESYKSVAKKVGKLLYTSFGKTNLTPFEIVTRERMDRIMPPRIQERILVAANDMAIKDSSIDEIENQIRDFETRWTSRDRPAKEIANIAIEIIVDCRLRRIPFDALPLENHIERIFKKRAPKTYDLAMKWESWLHDIIGFSLQGVVHKRQEYERQYRTTIFAGCFSNGEIYLCHSRIDRDASELGCDFSDMLQIIWVHEEMHAILRSSLKSELEEHLVQMMTAGVFAKAKKTNLVGIMKRFAVRQPSEYGLFAQEPNSALLSSLKSVPQQKKISTRRSESAPSVSTKAIREWRDESRSPDSRPVRFGE